jgi:hypothetical protein
LLDGETVIGKSGFECIAAVGLGPGVGDDLADLSHVVTEALRLLLLFPAI